MNESVVEEDDDNSFLAISADVTGEQNDMSNIVRNQELNDISRGITGKYDDAAPRRNSALKRKQSASLRK